MFYEGEIRMIRIFNFKNTWFGDNISGIEAEYNVFGRYDAMDTRVLNSVLEIKDILMNLDKVDQNIDNKNYDFFPLIAISESDDRNFWEKGNAPFIFISCIRLMEMEGNLKDLINNLNKPQERFCYTTLDNNDLIVCIRVDSLKEGFRKIIDLEDVFGRYEGKRMIKRRLTVLCIWQEVLNEISSTGHGGFTARIEKRKIRNEKISAFLRITMKNQEMLNVFLKKLKTNYKIDIEEYYWTLGNDDVIVILKDKPVNDFLNLYKKGGPLTHSEYKDLIYNVNTEILFKNREEQRCRLM